MKRLFLILTSVVFLVVIFGCKSENSTTNSSLSSTTTEIQDSTTTTTEEQEQSYEDYIKEQLKDFEIAIDLTNVTEGFKLPLTHKDLQLNWELGSETKYLILEQKLGNYINAKVTPIELGYTDQVVTLILTANYNNSTFTKEYEVTIKARTMPISEFYELEDGSDIIIGGIVYAKARVGEEGYYIYDKSGNAFVYELSDDVNLGDEIIIKGKKSIYHNIHEITYDNPDEDIEVISTDNEMPEYEQSRVSEILKMEGNYKSLAKNVVLQAKVIKKYENFMTNFYLEDIITGEQVFIYYKSAQDLAGLYEGKYVKVKVNIYNYNDSTGEWSVFLSNNTNDIEEITPDITDEEKVINVGYYLESSYQGKKFSDDIDLVNTDPNWGSVITWKSNNTDVVSDTGKVTLQEEAVDVVLTATIKVGETIITKDITIIIEPINIEALKNIIEWQVENTNDTKEVVFEAIVVATRGTSGYFVIDDGYGYYIMGNPLDVKPGDKVRIIGTTKYSRQPYISDKRLEKVISSGNPIPNPVKYTAEQFNSQTKDSTFYNSYIEIEGILKAKETQYGYTYLLQIGDQEASIHSASNKFGFHYLIDSKISLTCFVNRINSDYTTWELFIINRDGDIKSLESDQAKLSMGVDYLDQIFETNSIITTDLRLPSHHPALIDVTYTYESSNTEVFSNDGKYLYPDEDTNIDFTITVNVNGLTQTKTYNFIIKQGNESLPTDLVFTFLLHGIVNDKMFAIYNGTGRDIDLSNYRIFAVQNTGIGSNEYNINGDNVVGILQLEGTIKNGETIIVHHSGTNVVILNQIPDTVVKISTPNQNGVAQFNGKDGDILILQRDSVIIDQIGSFEKVNSKGQKTSWEEEYFGNKMLIRTKLVNTPALDWSDFEEVNQYWSSYPASEAPDYLLPTIAWDYLNGEFPE